MGGYYWDGPWHMVGGVGWLFPFFMVGFIFLCVYLLIRTPRGHARDATSSALRLLNERFAKGEISKEELEEKREFLLRSP